MAKSDYRRPADYQITNHFKCSSCGRETEQNSVYAAPEACPSCGGPLQHAGESYPASADDWHEERDNVNDDFRNPYQRRY